MSTRLASLFTLSLLSTLCPLSARAETPPSAPPGLTAPPAAPAPRASPKATSFRLGVDGSVGIGVIGYASVGLRAEWALSRKTFLLAGLAYLNGAPMEEGVGFQAGVPTLGFRWCAARSAPS